MVHAGADPERALQRAVAASVDAPARLAPVLGDLFAGVPALGSEPRAIARLLRQSGATHRWRVLDLGCGKGAVAVEVARRIGCRVLGVDAHRPFVESARALACRRGVGDRCRFLVGDARRARPGVRGPRARGCSAFVRSASVCRVPTLHAGHRTGSGSAAVSERSMLTVPSTPAPRAPGSRRAGGSAARLRELGDRVLAGHRLTLDEGMELYATPDVWGLCALADAVRRRLHGDTAYYNVNRHFNYSNVCALSCKFCDFYAKQGDDKAYTRTIDQAREEARRAIDSGATEIHIVGGLHPHLPFEYYTDMIRAIREAAAAAGSGLHIKAFTAVEIVHLARIARVYRREDRGSGIRWVLERLKEAGLGSLPGGGAEVFDDRVHDEAYKGKIRSDVWLDVHRTAHELGLNTNATILYGHIEDRRERLVHMDMLRRAQDRALARLGYAPGDAPPVPRACDDADPPPITLTRPGTPLPEQVAFRVPRAGRPSTPDPGHAGLLPGCGPAPAPRRDPGPVPAATGYFQTIIPLPFFPDGSALEHLPGPAGLENLRTLAVARLMLDNFPHVKAFWIMQTLAMAQLMLQCGADDIDGTVVWYDITKVPQGGTMGDAMEGGTHQEVSVWTLQKAIREAGFTPVERDTLYRRVRRDGKAWSVDA